MKVNLLTLHYWPEDYAAGIYLTNFASKLSEKENIEITTAFPNYPLGTVFKEYKGKFFLSEFKNGIKVNRSFICAVPKEKNIFLRLLPFITFSISSFISLIKNKKFDVLFVVFPILPIALSSLLFSKIFNKKIVFGVKDLSVEGLRASKKIKSKTILNFLDWFEVTIYKRADLIQVTSKQQFNYFYSRGISKNKIEFIPDWGDSEKISLIEPDSYMLNRFKGNSKKIIIYSGNIGLSSELKTIVKVMKRFSPDEIKLLITGDGVMKKELVEFVIENNIRNVEFSDFVPYEDLGKLLSIADICLVTLNKQFTKVATQGKIYNILAAGKPIFAIMEEDAEFVKEIKKENLGLLAEPDDEESIYKQLKKVVDDKISFANSNEIRHFFMNNYTINQIMPKYHALFKKLEKKNEL